MTEVDKLMKPTTDGSGTEQFYPESVPDAIVGLDDYIAEKAGSGPAGAKGDTGQRGSIWYTGTAITGTSTTPTAFSSSAIDSALAGDMYLNTSTSNVYQCTTGGNAATALWKYLENIKGNTGATGAAGKDGKDGTNATTTAVATTTANGLMSSTDKVKLNNLTVITLVKVKDV